MLNSFPVLTCLFVPSIVWLFFATDFPLAVHHITRSVLCCQLWAVPLSGIISCGGYSCIPLFPTRFAFAYHYCCWGGILFLCCLLVHLCPIFKHLVQYILGFQSYTILWSNRFPFGFWTLILVGISFVIFQTKRRIYN